MHSPTRGSGNRYHHHTGSTSSPDHPGSHGLYLQQKRNIMIGTSVANQSGEIYIYFNCHLE